MLLILQGTYFSPSENTFLFMYYAIYHYDGRCQFYLQVGWTGVVKQGPCMFRAKRYVGTCKSYS